MTATRLATQKEMGQKSASGTTPPISAKPVKGNFRIAVCCRSVRIRRSHDLTVIVDELRNR